MYVFIYLSICACKINAQFNFIALLTCPYSELKLFNYFVEILFIREQNTLILLREKQRVNEIENEREEKMCEFSAETCCALSHTIMIRW